MGSRRRPQGLRTSSWWPYVQLRTPQSGGLRDCCQVRVVLLLLEKALYEALLARVVIGGLLFATPTTLLIVPYATQGQRRQPAHGEFDEGLP